MGRGQNNIDASSGPSPRDSDDDYLDELDVARGDEAGSEDNEDEEQDNEVALEWLRNLPENAELVWSTRHFDKEAPFSKGWVDVYLDALAQEIGWNWAWTIENPQNPEFEDEDYSSDIFNYPVAYDSTLEMRMPENKDYGEPAEVRVIYPNGSVIDIDPKEEDYFGGAVDDDAEREFQADMKWSTLQSTEPGEFMGKIYPPGAREDLRVNDAGQSERWIICPVWSPKAVSDGLQTWMEEKLSRPDVTFRWDPEGADPMLDAAKQIKAEIDAGEMETYEIGEGLTASSEAMDFLLALEPDQAAQITEEMQEVAKSLRKNKEGEEDSQD